ncbi:hypothetical protein [Streptomyces sp. MK7]|uniref:hypothetical protein n=1 Tax=Streptomyces sp. MK7 TaxID=3067635 RepID=UPI00292F882F|nr:hypothetical protein [Streptomyces sp. MK7]
MTFCASPGLSAAHEQEGPPPPAADEDGGAARAGCAITVDGAYAARLTHSGESWYPERWTLDGPEPYAVPLPGNQPEEPGTEVQPMGDGRVLIRRLVDGRHTFSLLYPTGPGTGELPLGAVESPEGTVLRLLPPAPGGERAYALAAGSRSSAVWLVAGGSFGPELLAEVPGHCSGGVWLDRTGRMLALDRRAGGRTKTVVVDLVDGGAVSPLLQITPGSDDRLLLADPDSGLLLIGSDAASPGRERLGWGVLGSTLPVRFPECLLMSSDCAMTPFAIQPGQVLTPEQCAVALHCQGPFGSWIGVWRPTERAVRHLPAPEGWLAGAGLWTEDGVLRLPYATAAVPCGVARWTAAAEAGGQAAMQEPTAAHGQATVREPAAPAAARLPGPREAHRPERQEEAHRPGPRAARPAAPEGAAHPAQESSHVAQPAQTAGTQRAPRTAPAPETPQAPQTPHNPPRTPPPAPPRVPLPLSLPLPSSTDEVPRPPHAEAPETESPASAAARPVPLQQAALTGRMATG